MDHVEGSKNGSVELGEKIMGYSGIFSSLKEVPSNNSVVRETLLEEED